jgi:hypothetical protein
MQMSRLAIVNDAVLEIAVFLVACALCWCVGNTLVQKLWTNIVTGFSVASGTVTALGPVVGRLENVLYIFAVMADKYDIIPGWLVMKAFFGWIHVRPRSQDAQAKEGHDALAKFNEYLIGNLLSLFLGLSFGLGARLVVQLLHA